MTADENENQPRELKVGTYITFRVKMKIAQALASPAQLARVSLKIYIFLSLFFFTEPPLHKIKLY